MAEQKKPTPPAPPVTLVTDRQPMEHQIFKAEEIKAKHPGRHFRFVNTKVREIADLRTGMQGYTPMEGPEALTLGETRLMSTPKEQFEAREKRRAEITRSREGSIAKTTDEQLRRVGVRPTTDDGGMSAEQTIDLKE